MGSFADYCEEAVLKHVFKITQMTVPTNLYVALVNTTLTDTCHGTALNGEVTAGQGGYARKQCNTWVYTGGDTLSNSIALSFVQATTGYGKTLSFFAVCDHSSTGNAIVWGALGVSKKITTNDTAKFASKDIDITLD